MPGMMDGIKTERRVLKKMMQNCRCDTLEQCGKGIFSERVRRCCGEISALETSTKLMSQRR
jgi:hypothetical protein